MQEKGIKGEWRGNNTTVNVELPVMLFEEDGTSIAYIPVLDISGYGVDENEAMESLKICLGEYFSYTTHKNTLREDLIAHGWTVRKKTKPYIAPEITDIINKNEYLHDIVNSRSYKMNRMSYDMPQYADC